mmetsp:Transcript_58778/g.127140  ORF Transcript_58778/g.127140 Transcript_58778/m.127140 type:complete len:81 (-) Transcript_58778:452-694(-)
MLKRHLHIRVREFWEDELQEYHYNPHANCGSQERYGPYDGRERLGDPVGYQVAQVIVGGQGLESLVSDYSHSVMSLPAAV